MSKSLGNVIAPQKVMSTLGADVLRLWVAATDYANEMSVSDEILKRMADSYRRMRNTVRFLLGNLHGFDPKRHMRGAGGHGGARSLGAVARARAAGRSGRGLSQATSSTSIYQKVHNFCVVDLGGFYLDVIKDRLYTMPTREPRAPLGADGDVSTSRRAWCAGSRRSCRSRRKRSGSSCRASARSRCSSRPGMSCRRCRATASTGTR